MSESQIQELVEKLKSAVAEQGFVDIGMGASDHLGVTPFVLISAVDILQQEGLTVQKYKVQQKGTENFVNVRVLQEPNKANYKAVFDAINKSESETQALAFVNETSPLEREISSVLNKHSAENESNTPDFILAEYLMACLNAFNTANNSLKAFEGRDMESIPDEG